MRKAPIFPIMAVLVAAIVLLIFYVYSRPLDQTETKQTGSGTKTVTPLDTPSVDFANPAIGPIDASVVIVEFGDYLCPACATLEQDLRQLTAKYPKDLRLVWKDLPNEKSHPGSVLAAIAGRCAGLQGAFWEYHDLLMAGQAGVDMEGYSQAATILGLDAEAFQSCLTDQTTKPLVDRDWEEGVRLQIDVTPYMFINGKRFSGAVSKEVIDSAIQSELNWQATRESTNGTGDNAAGQGTETVTE